MRLLLLMLLVAIALPAAGQQLYRWKDDNGVVHYTDSPPPDKSFETREFVPEPEQPAATAPAAPTAAPSERCLQARANLQVFDTNETVSMDTDGDGIEEQLQGEVREREHQRAHELVQVECG
jgi:hypothetical protein